MKTLLACLVFVVACGGGGGSNNDETDPNGDANDGVAGGFDGGVHDAPFSGGCTPNTGPQCSNCKDDDGDGKVDGDDPQCTGPLDNDEASFATGIPGDNIDAVDQDCFF